MSLAEDAVEKLRRRSFVGRHRVLSLILLPLFSLPVVWTGLLLCCGLLTNIFSPAHRLGSLTHGERALWLAVGWACDWIVPVLCAAGFYLLARRRVCGAAWSWAACVVIATFFAFTYVNTGAAPNGVIVVRMSVVPVPSVLRWMPPVLVAASLELLFRLRGQRRARIA